MFMPATQSKIDARLMAPFVRSVRSVLATMAGVETAIGPMRLKESPSPEYDYSGIIGISGSIVGTVVVSFKRETAVKLVAAFAGAEVEPDTPDFADAIGELANMIAGAAKKDLGGDSSITVPSVISGRGHSVSRPKDVPCVVFPCSTAAGDFAVEVSIRSN
jgi:chemotaxis protein CheX